MKAARLGLTRAGDVADVAYLASRDATFDDCRAIDNKHVWDDGAAWGERDVEVNAARRYELLWCCQLLSYSVACYALTIIFPEQKTNKTNGNQSQCNGI